MNSSIRGRAICLLSGLMLIAAAAYARNALPRIYDLFELGTQRSQLDLGPNSFICEELSPVSIECIVMGYPHRDDFVILKFYRGGLVSVAHFVSGADWKNTLNDTMTKLGKPAMEPYKSDKALAYIWRDKTTHITLTYMTGLDYLIYEVRDIKNEPLFRRAAKAR